MRYAVYFLCEPERDLATFAAQWLGYDIELGEIVMKTQHPATPQHWISEPKRYGFHATIKAPFRLAASYKTEDLVSALSRFCDAESSQSLGTLKLRQIRDFLALVPETPNEALPAFAQRCVVALHEFQTPLSEADRERRLRSTLSTREIELMDRWGYPYVCELYRFHMTLTNSLSQPDLAAASTLLAGRLDGISLDVSIDALSLCVQPSPAEPFRLLKRIPLKTI